MVSDSSLIDTDRANPWKYCPIRETLQQNVLFFKMRHFSYNNVSSRGTFFILTVLLKRPPYVSEDNE